MSRYVFDIETNGFLDQLDRVHCIVLKDIDTGAVLSCHNHSDLDGPDLPSGMKLLMKADCIIGHNIIAFDIPALQKVYPWFSIDPAKVFDTFVMARLYEANIKERDLLPVNKGKYPKALFGQQGLEAWGYRLGDYKGDYKGPWDTWSPEMQSYCEQDVEVTHKLYSHLTNRERWPVAEELEHAAQYLCSQIERNGIPFDVDGAVKLYGELAEVRERMTAELKVLFPPWVINQGEYVSKANNSKTGHSIGATYTKILINEFNPKSRDHIANRLKAKYGWQPTEFTDGGKPKVDEKVLNALDYPEAKPLAELFLILKRIGQIAEGTEAWLKRESEGWVHYRLNPNGAVTGRATHSKVNITQVPKVGSRYGKECRSLWGLIEEPLRNRKLWDRWKDGVLYGSDVAGLELRCLAHYMARYDQGAYGKAVVEGKEEDGTDVHSLNTRALGMDPKKVYTINGKAQTGRNCSKTFIYAFLYGAGDAKIAKTIGKPEKKGRSVKLDFLQRTPALKALREAVETASKRGYLKALDGRHMHVRSSHAALNTLLQGAGALICKKWIVELDRMLREEECYEHGWDGDYAFLIWAHDEVQIACRTPEISQYVACASIRAIQATEAYFGIKVPLDVGGKTGKTWKDTH
jgi:DNA polymerase-1